MLILLICSSEFLFSFSAIDKNYTTSHFNFGGLTITLQTRDIEYRDRDGNLMYTVHQENVSLTSYFPPPPITGSGGWENTGRTNHKRSIIEKNDQLVNQFDVDVNSNRIIVRNISSDFYQIIISDIMGNVYLDEIKNNSETFYDLNSFDSKYIIVSIKNNNNQLIKKIMR